jgi:hypothetical protein
LVIQTSLENNMIGDNEMATYGPNAGQFDLDLVSSGGGWCGTFAALVRHAASDILSDGAPFGPVEVTYDDDTTVLVGILIDSDDQYLLVDDYPVSLGTLHSIDIEAVTRFRA